MYTMPHRSKDSTEFTHAKPAGGGESGVVGLLVLRVSPKA